jgi:hypothetical protein
MSPQTAADGSSFAGPRPCSPSWKPLDRPCPGAEDYLNQGMALFRFLTSMPTDAEPPAVPRLVQVARATPEPEERPARD